MNPKIIAYVKLLLKWQKSVNLISAKTEVEIWQRHIDDSLQLVKFIPKTAEAIIDLGSGAGLPGIPLAVETNLPTYLIESDRKKSLFMEEAARQLKLAAKIINTRIEEARLPTPHTEKEFVITARALAELEKLFELINSFLEKNNITRYKLLLLKGRNAAKEIETAQKRWDFSLIGEKSQTDSDSSILIIENLHRKADR